MPWAPQATMRRASATTSGALRSRELRSRASLLTLTLSDTDEGLRGEGEAISTNLPQFAGIAPMRSKPPPLDASDPRKSAGERASAPTDRAALANAVPLFLYSARSPSPPDRSNRPASARLATTTHEPFPHFKEGRSIDFTLPKRTRHRAESDFTSSQNIDSNRGVSPIRCHNPVRHDSPLPAPSDQNVRSPRPLLAISSRGAAYKSQNLPSFSVDR
jgi:hypothetical protein